MKSKNYTLLSLLCSILDMLVTTNLITLKVYDVLGKEVVTLVNEEKPPGNYEVEFVGDGIPSGIYFYQLRAGSYVETMKMVLLR